MPVAEFGERMERLVAELKGAPLAAGCAEIFYPGEIEARSAAKHERDGLALPEQTLADLLELAQTLGVGMEIGMD
jgi:LDH2 family malate/lactate/ureidoglycolate dehydrogenase